MVICGFIALTQNTIMRKLIFVFGFFLSLSLTAQKYVDKGFADKFELKMANRT